MKIKKESFVKLFQYNSIYIFLIIVLLCVSVYGCGRSTNIQKIDSPQIGYSVIDAFGNKIYFSQKPIRIVSLGLSSDEVIIKIVPKSRILALSTRADEIGISNITELVKDIPLRGSVHSVENILKMNPDVVIIPDFYSSEVYQTFRDLGIKIFIYKTPTNIQESMRFVNELAVVVGEKSQGKAIIGTMERKLQSINNKIKNISERKRVILVRPTGVFYAPKSIFGDVCKHAGVFDVTQELKPFYDMKNTKITQEEIIRLNPDIIIITDWSDAGQNDPRKQREEILNNPAYKHINAIKNGQVILLPGRHLLTGSQFIVNSVEAVARISYPSYFF